jgi:hypothetical protein
MARLARGISTLPIVPPAPLPANVFIGFDWNICAANVKALGATDFAFSAGDQADVIVRGTAIVTVGAGGSVAVGDKLTSDALGKAQAAGANPVNGYALEAGAPGALIEVELV